MEISQIRYFLSLSKTLNFTRAANECNISQPALSRAILQLETAGITHLMVLGGNGSIRGAAALAKAGIKVVGLPGTIDNDVAGSEDSIGFDTATNFGLQMIDQFRDTLEALPRLCVLETLGGDTGFLALEIARAGGADIALLPEHPMLYSELETRTRAAIQNHNYALIVASEGYPDLEQTVLNLEKDIGLRLRFSRPNHAMRGGRPSAHDRTLAATLGMAGVKALARGESGMIGWQSGKTRLLEFKDIPLKKNLKLEEIL